MKKRNKIFLLLILLFFLQFPLFYKFWLTRLGAFLIHHDRIEPADAILVLGGGRGERILQGVELYKKNYGRTILMTGEFFEPLFYQKTLHWALQGKALAHSRGVPNERIIPILNSLSTRDDATLSRAECEKRGFKSLIVISEPFHTKRAYYTFKKVYKNSGIKVMLYPVQNSWYKKDTWWLSEKGLLTANEEYVKFMYYLLKRYIL